MNNITLKVQPRQSMSWEEFITSTPRGSIALDGAVLGGPRFDKKTLHVNFDHHDNVIREATMSTAQQVYYAIKGGLHEMFPRPFVYVNDSDQDTTLGVFLLENYGLFEGTKSYQKFERFLELDARLDITGGSFPMDLNDILLQEHNRVFEPYNKFRTSGELFTADSKAMRKNIEIMIPRIHDLLQDKAKRLTLQTDHDILYQSNDFYVIDEKMSPHARHYCYSQGMNAFVSVKGRRQNGRYDYSIGKRSRFIPFPIEQLYDYLNWMEGFPSQQGRGGSDIIGGSPRMSGSALSPETLAREIQSYIDDRRCQI